MLLLKQKIAINTHPVEAAEESVLRRLRHSKTGFVSLYRHICHVALFPRHRNDSREAGSNSMSLADKDSSHVYQCQAFTV